MTEKVVNLAEVRQKKRRRIGWTLSEIEKPLGPFDKLRACGGTGPGMRPHGCHTSR